MADSKWYNNDILVGFALILLFFIGFLSLDLFVFKRPSIVFTPSPSPVVSPTPIPTPPVIPSEYPDYDSLSNLRSLNITKDFESWTPNTNIENKKLVDTLIVEKGSISKGYIYIKASLSSNTPTPFTQWESIYMKMNDWGGHLFRPQTLKIPPSNVTELLFALNNIPYLSTLPYSESRIPLRANWFSLFKDKNEIRIVSFISSLRPAKIEEMTLYYECLNGEECEVKMK